MNVKPETVTNPDPSVRTLELATKELDALREVFAAKFDGMRELTEEKFRGVSTKFEERKTALEAALKTAQEAVKESGASFTKQIEACDYKIQSLKERMDRGEGRSNGAQWMWGVVAGVLALIVAIVGIVLKLN